MNTALNFIHPTLLLDTDKCRRNIERMCAKMQQNAVQFRPHFKTHQSHEIGRWFRDYGIHNITVSSLRMAWYFADDGWNDITVAFPVNLLEKDLLNHLSGMIRLHVLAEDADVIGDLDRILVHQTGVFLKIDTGTHRTGIDPADFATIETCVKAIAHSKHLHWDGFLAHAGHTYRLHHRQPDIQTVYKESLKDLFVLRDHYRSRYPDILVSFGDTPGASILEEFTGIDEMRPGNFVFYDTMQLQIGSCSADDIAVAMICPVVAIHHRRNECVVYGGGIHFSKDSIVGDDNHLSYGTVVSFSGEKWDTGQVLGQVRGLSQEHGVIQLSQTDHEIRPGRCVSVLPVHSCMTAQCMGAYLDQRGNALDHFATSRYYLKTKDL